MFPPLDNTCSSMDNTCSTPADGPANFSVVLGRKSISALTFAEPRKCQYNMCQEHEKGAAQLEVHRIGSRLFPSSETPQANME